MKEYKYKINGNEYAVCINEVCDTAAKVTVNGAEYNVEWEKPVEEKPVVKVQPVAAKPAPAPAAKPTVAQVPVSGYSIKHGVKIVWETELMRHFTVKLARVEE